MTAPVAVTTCQVCGRPIKAALGVIAHHGYRRPMHGSGWQTASCLGARFAPFQRSCDRLRHVIGVVEAHRAALAENLAGIETTPPDFLLFDDRTQPRRRYSYGPPPEMRRVDRPADFDPKRYDYRPDSYATVYNNLLFKLRADLRGTDATLADMRARLASWRAPEAVA